MLVGERPRLREGMRANAAKTPWSIPWRGDETLVSRLRIRFLAAMGATVVVCTVLSAPASGAPNEYVRMSDGTSIAINVRMPKDFEPGRRYPTIFEMSGYDGGSSDGTTPGGVLGEGSRGLTRMFEDD
jgi:hypothetical protein